MMQQMDGQQQMQQPQWGLHMPTPQFQTPPMQLNFQPLQQETEQTGFNLPPIGLPQQSPAIGLPQSQFTFYPTYAEETAPAQLEGCEASGDGGADTGAAGGLEDPPTIESVPASDEAATELKTRDAKLNKNKPKQKSLCMVCL